MQAAARSYIGRVHRDYLLAVQPQMLLLLCALVLAAECGSSGGSVVQFSAAREAGSESRLCAVDAATESRPVRSLVDCSTQCGGDGRCHSFNYRTTPGQSRTAGATAVCDMFSIVPCNFTTATESCRYYRVNTRLSLA